MYALLCTSPLLACCNATAASISAAARAASPSPTKSKPHPPEWCWPGASCSAACCAAPAAAPAVLCCCCSSSSSSGTCRLSRSLNRGSSIASFRLTISLSALLTRVFSPLLTRVSSLSGPASTFALVRAEGETSRGERGGTKGEEGAEAEGCCCWPC